MLQYSGWEKPKSPDEKSPCSLQRPYSIFDLEYQVIMILKQRSQ